MKKHILLLTLMFAASAAASERVAIGKFSASSLERWKNKSFVGKTRYSLAEIDGTTVLKAHSDASASGLYYRKKIDLDKTPYLNWSWRVDKLQDNLNERSKRGDDYPARIYVVFSSGPFVWQQVALNYVWSNNQNPGSAWKSAYTRQSQMLALQGGDERKGQWVTEKRNLREDLKRYFGNKKRKVQAIAIMTDSDNSGGEYTSYYGDIYLSAE